VHLPVMRGFWGGRLHGARCAKWLAAAFFVGTVLGGEADDAYMV